MTKFRHIRIESIDRQHPAFSSFPTVFSTRSKREIITLAMFNLSFANAFNLVTPKILSFVKSSPLTTQSWLLMTLRKKPFKNIVGKGENAGKQHFLLCPRCFPLKSYMQIRNAYNFEWCQILLFCEELKHIFFCSHDILKHSLLSLFTTEMFDERLENTSWKGNMLSCCKTKTHS